MTCHHINAGGFRAIVCSRSERDHKCKHCGGTATLQCDGKLPRGGTCDAHICARCSTPGGDNIDFCREHEAQARQGALL